MCPTCCPPQALGVALKLTFQGDNQLIYVHTYVFMLVRGAWSMVAAAEGHVVPAAIEESDSTPSGEACLCNAGLLVRNWCMAPYDNASGAAAAAECCLGPAQHLPLHACTTRQPPSMLSNSMLQPGPAVTTPPTPLSSHVPPSAHHPGSCCVLPHSPPPFSTLKHSPPPSLPTQTHTTPPPPNPGRWWPAAL